MAEDQLLDNDVAGVDPGIDAMDGDTLGSIIEPRPEVRISPPVPWQQADVNVDDAIGEIIDDALRYNPPVSKRHHPVGGGRPFIVFIATPEGVSCLLQSGEKQFGVWRKQENLH